MGYACATLYNIAKLLTVVIFWNMSMKICLYIKFIALLFFCCSAYSTAHDSQDNKYLLKPTGAYGIGYQDVFLINTDMVPR